MVLALDARIAIDFYSKPVLHRADCLGRRVWLSGRAWTLQEGALASQLRFQFENGLLFAKEAQRTFNETLKVAVWNRSFDEKIQLLKDCQKAWFLPPVGNHRSDNIHGLSACDVQFMGMWNSLLGRSTTQLDDFYEIVANLLDFDASYIRKLGAISNMMEAMILHQERIPLDLLYVASDDHNRNTHVEFRVPTRPRDVILSEESFKTSLTSHLDKGILLYTEAMGQLVTD
ncbi:hypothetical protein B0H63DRAFT_542848 [Podospora didyma]|uniref:Uncharacterized protein n=1 Tax=Podospora didyma TaxID=330526 RepID=A0AAE0TZ53_9PEZI|nr:hypothetical protein B0H63DRAFT_542848 [Podospora didyma]